MFFGAPHSKEAKPYLLYLSAEDRRFDGLSMSIYTIHENISVTQSPVKTKATLAVGLFV